MRGGHTHKHDAYLAKHTHNTILEKRKHEQHEHTFVNGT